MPTNTVDPKLQFTAYMNAALVSFRRHVIPVNILGAVYTDVPREGKNTLTLPKLSRNTNAPSLRSPRGSYKALAQNTAVGAIELTLDQNPVHVLSFSNEELASQPRLMVEEQGTLAGEKLAYDVLSTITGVFTQANYTGGEQGHPEPIAADDFDFAYARDAMKLCTKDHWPYTGRAMILNPDLGAGLAKSPVSVEVSKSADPSVFRDGMVRRIAGFDTVETPALGDNGENLGGVILMPGALVIGFAPIRPTPAIRAQLFDYQVIEDQYSGIVLEYRHYADADTSEEVRVLECHFGFQVGLPENAKLIATAA